MSRRAARRIRRKAVSLPQRQLAARNCVRLDHGAFIGLVLSGIETYRRECYGVLLGVERGGIIHVQSAQPYQTALRRPRSVIVRDSRRRALKNALRDMATHDVLGEFHSHVHLGAAGVCETLSRDDMAGVAERELQILIALRPKRNKVSWRHNSDGSLSGVAGPYFVRLRAFFGIKTRTGAVLPRVAPIQCRHAQGAAMEWGWANGN